MKTQPWLTVMLGIIAGILLFSIAAALFLLGGDETAIASAETSTTAAPVETTGETRAATSVMDLAEQFRMAVNSGDAAAVAELAPILPEAIEDFLIGGGPYPEVDCYLYAEREECRMVNGIADFVFVIDLESGLVTTVTYVGGE